MATLIVVLAVLGLVHWVYEGTVAPSLRLSLKFDLFAIRDEARRLERASEDPVDRAAGRALCHVVDRAMAGLDVLTIPWLFKLFRAAKTSPQVREDVAREADLVSGLGSKSSIQLFGRSIIVITKAAVINSAMLLFYFSWLLPFIFVFTWWKVEAGAKTYAYADETVSVQGHSIRLAA